MERQERLFQGAVIVIGAVALFAALHAVSTIFAPLALALVAGVVLSPISDFWERRHLPNAFGALLTLSLAMIVFALIGAMLQPVVASLVKQAPKVWSDVQDAIGALRSLARGLTEVTQNVGNAIAQPANAAAANATPDKDAALQLPSLTSALMLAPEIIGEMLIFIGSLFFFLLTRNQIYTWAAKHMTEPAERGHLVRRMREAERRVSRYFLTITVINAGLGVAASISLQLIGLPSAMTWGLVIFLVNFIPYLGPATGMVLMLYAGVAAFEGAASAGPALVYLALISIESQFITPALIGRNVAVNPLLIFLSLVFGMWLWGPIGGIVAIPLLLWVLVLNDALPSVTLTQKQRRAAEFRLDSMD